MKGRAEPFAHRPALVRLGLPVLLALTLAYLFLIGGELLLQVGQWRTLHRDRDFPSYYLAARRLLVGQDMYSGLQSDARALGIDDYFIDSAVNPPTFAVVSVWLALFPYPVAWGLWQVLSLAALAAALFLVVRELGWPASPTGKLLLACLVLLFPPLGFHLLYAHTELFLLLMLAGAWLFLRRGRQVPAGILLGLAGAIRIYPLFLLFYLLQRRAWKGLLAAIGSGLGLAMLSALVVGPTSFLRYLSALRDTVPSLYPRWGNFSLWGTVFKISSLWPALESAPALCSVLALACSLLILALTLWLVRRPGQAVEALDREYGLYLVAALLASPLSWVYYQVLLYLPLLFLGRVVRKSPAIVHWALGVALAASLAPLVSALVSWPEAMGRVLAFLPTLTLGGVYVGLVFWRSREIVAGPQSPIATENQF